MEKEIVISHWGKELDRKIAKVQENITQNQKKLTDRTYNTVQVEVEITSNINSLEQLKKKKSLYSPSCIIGQINVLEDEISSKSNDIEKAITSATSKVNTISQQIAAMQLKIDIAKQFNGNADGTQEIENMKLELTQASSELEELQQQYRIFTIARNHKKEDCMVSKDTPGYRLRALHRELIQETKDFKKDTESKIIELYAEIDTAVETVINAAERLGKLGAIVNIRDLELNSIGCEETGLQDKLKMITVNPNFRTDILYQKFNAGRSI